MFKLKIIVTLTGLTLFFLRCRNNEADKKDTVEASSQEVIFKYDKRVETVYNVLMLSGEYDQLISRHPSKYKNKATKYYAGFKDHRAVQIAAKLINRGFCFDYAVNWICQFSDFPAFQKTDSVHFPFSERAINIDSLELFRKELVNFYVDAKCDSFFVTQKEFFETMLSKAQTSMIRKDLPTQIENYYGIFKKSSCAVILSPLLHSGGYAIESDNNKNHQKHLSAVCGPNGEIDFIPVFDRQFLEFDMIIHELGHNYVNPIVDAFKSERDALTLQLYPPVKESMEDEGIGEESFMYELLDRAITLRIVNNLYGADAGKQLLDYEKSIGFKSIEAVAEQLKTYEKQRDKYPSIKEFMPEIFKVLHQNGSK